MAMPFRFTVGDSDDDGFWDTIGYNEDQSVTGRAAYHAQQGGERRVAAAAPLTDVQQPIRDQDVAAETAAERKKRMARDRSRRYRERERERAVQVRHLARTVNASEVCDPTPAHDCTAVRWKKRAMRRTSLRPLLPGIHSKRATESVLKDAGTGIVLRLHLLKVMSGRTMVSPLQLQELSATHGRQRNGNEPTELP